MVDDGEVLSLLWSARQTQLRRRLSGSLDHTSHVSTQLFGTKYFLILAAFRLTICHSILAEGKVVFY